MMNLQPPTLPQPEPYQPPTYDQKVMEVSALFEVSPTEVMETMQKLGVSPIQAALYVAMNGLWKRVAEQNGVLTGNPQEDQMKMMQHDQFTQGLEQRDPLHENPDAMNQFYTESMNLAQKGMM